MYFTKTTNFLYHLNIQIFFLPASGQTLVKGTSAMIHAWAIHRHPQYWGEDAEQFRPERFLEAPLKHPAAFLPFSYGPRNCIGKLQYT